MVPALEPDACAILSLMTYQEGFRRLGPDDHPDVSLDCIALARSMPAWNRGDHAAVRDILAESVRRLAGAGADFFACPDNTAHLALDEPGRALDLPGLHIGEVVAAAAARAGYRRVGVLGTRFTMDGPMYPRVLAKLRCSRRNKQMSGYPAVH